MVHATAGQNPAIKAARWLAVLPGAVAAGWAAWVAISLLSPAAAERARIHHRQPLATTGAPDVPTQMVADQPPAAPRQDWWAASETCPLLLASARREPPDPPPVWVDAPADLGVACAERLTDNGGRRPSLTKNGRNAGKVSENCELWRVRRPEFRSPWRAS